MKRRTEVTGFAALILIADDGGRKLGLRMSTIDKIVSAADHKHTRKYRVLRKRLIKAVGLA